jgi:CRP/FNR family transcriptional regulator, cyclic AMP receptor protein
MTPSTTTLGSHRQIEDVLAHLPISSTTEYGRRQMIYGPDNLTKSIYLVITGNVGISQIAEDGSEVLLDIVRPDDIFGESAFLDSTRRSEQATAIERAKLMTWSVSDMEDLVMKRPRLAVGLLQILARRNAELTRRIESFSIDTIGRRLARALIRLSERLGTPDEDGSVRMMPLTHEMLSRYIGASRELVTQYMNQFRRQGYMTYSRRGILLYRDSLKTLLDRSGLPSAEKAS